MILRTNDFELQRFWRKRARMETSYDVSSFFTRGEIDNCRIMLYDKSQIDRENERTETELIVVKNDKLFENHMVIHLLGLSDLQSLIFKWINEENRIKSSIFIDKLNVIESAYQAIILEIPINNDEFFRMALMALTCNILSLNSQKE